MASGERCRLKFCRFPHEEEILYEYKPLREKTRELEQP